MEKYYVYLNHPYGVELIGSGTLEECEKIKAKKDAQWQIGDYWSTEIVDHQIKEYSMYD